MRQLYSSKRSVRQAKKDGLAHLCNCCSKYTIFTELPVSRKKSKLEYTDSLPSITSQFWAQECSPRNLDAKLRHQRSSHLIRRDKWNGGYQNQWKYVLEMPERMRTACTAALSYTFTPNHKKLALKLKLYLPSLPAKVTDRFRVPN